MGWVLIVAAIYYVNTYLRYIGYMFTVLQSNHRRCGSRVPSDVDAVGYHLECLISGSGGASDRWPGERHSLSGSGSLEVVLSF